MYFKREVAMLKIRVASLRYNLERAKNNRLYKNFSVCGFLITCPKNGQTAKITYNGKVVGEVEDGKVLVNKYDKSIWRNETLKYDILCNIREELNKSEKEIKVVDITDADITAINLVNDTKYETGGKFVIVGDSAKEDDGEPASKKTGEVIEPEKAVRAKKPVAKKKNSAAAKAYLNGKKKKP